VFRFSFNIFFSYVVVRKVYASGESDFTEESGDKLRPVPKARVAAGQSWPVLARCLC